MIPEAAVETCGACDGVVFVHSEEDIPLCSLHWKKWRSLYRNAAAQPCEAHLIRDEAARDDRIKAALWALSKWQKAVTPPCPPRVNGEAHCPDCSGIV